MCFSRLITPHSLSESPSHRHWGGNSPCCISHCLVNPPFNSRPLAHRELTRYIPLQQGVSEAWAFSPGLYRAIHMLVVGFVQNNPWCDGYVSAGDDAVGSSCSPDACDGPSSKHSAPRLPGDFKYSSNEGGEGSALSILLQSFTNYFEYLLTEPVLYH
ncbi:hypothetical protein SRHO_G00305660 [Serrasalmus rhombeus]